MIMPLPIASNTVQEYALPNGVTVECDFQCKADGAERYLKHETRT
jgi:hypothetical protein